MVFLGKALILSLSLLLCSRMEAQNLVQNGSFEDVGIAGYSGQIGKFPTAPDQLQTVAGWRTSGYNFLFQPGAGTSGGAASGYGNPVTFWGSAAQNGGSSQFDFPASSPDGGNFLALDGGFAPYTLAVSQKLTGLTSGQVYQLTFYWAAAQQHGYTGATTEGMSVTFGEETHTTPTYQLPSHDFSGWMSSTFNFTATDSTQWLSFLAQGTPQGQPPFTLLDGVSMVAIPEVSSPTMIVLGMSVLCFARRRRA